MIPKSTHHQDYGFQDRNGRAFYVGQIHLGADKADAGCVLPRQMPGMALDYLDAMEPLPAGLKQT